MDSSLAEREGFEPPIRLPVCRISSAVLSTTQPPLQAFDPLCFSNFIPALSDRNATEMLLNALRYSRLECGVEPIRCTDLNCLGHMRI